MSLLFELFPVPSAESEPFNQLSEIHAKCPEGSRKGALETETKASTVRHGHPARRTSVVAWAGSLLKELIRNRKHRRRNESENDESATAGSSSAQHSMPITLGATSPAGSPRCTGITVGAISHVLTPGERNGSAATTFGNRWFLAATAKSKVKNAPIFLPLAVWLISGRYLFLNKKGSGRINPYKGRSTERNGKLIRSGRRTGGPYSPVPGSRGPTTNDASTRSGLHPSC
ncbi:hypothetical protein B0H17DRAFT_1256571 [Mycena rosella]|uniref:Uncharacterized protein n=1 Tax=Mycena rosella TaxID=1033263 RepID=A0AAD7G7C3_MYCRO|nr:hypothetical protein B0H17DRAFT_1256571 [Mycena rosella]